MALSQKHEGKCLVPWFCSAEWHFVYNKIFGPNTNEKSKREALDIINIWKARTPLLSRGLEGTYIILEAILLDRTAFEIYNLKLLLSTSIMRFLNICAASNKSQGTFYATAYKMKIPEWLINMRHDIAHGQNLPSIDILDRALKFSLEWLHQQYWKSTASEIKDFIDDTQFESDKTESLKYILQPLVSNYCYITLLTHPIWKYSSIQDICDEETRKIFLEEIISMTESDISETTNFNQVLEILWDKIRDILNKHAYLENKYHVLSELITEDVFLGEFEERDAIFKNDVPKDFIMLWENFMMLWEKMLINFDTEMLGVLIEQLLQILLLDKISHDAKKVAATWILEIGRGLEKALFIKSSVRELLAKMGSKPKQAILQSMIDEKLTAKYKKKVILNLNKYIEIPDVISDTSKFKTTILQKPTVYTKKFISELIDLNDTLKLPNNKQHVLELVNLYMSNENDDEETIVPSKIHSVEELAPLEMEVDQENDENKVPEVPQAVPVTKNTSDSKRWRRVTETNFEKCPIGILPWQTSSMNPLFV